MRTNYVLIDFENVQPKDLALLKGDHFKVKIFLGANQTKISVDLATALHALGERAEYIRLDASGQNALDFHIAYYIGVISVSDPTAFFHVISKDTGFDPLLRYLKTKGTFSSRTVAIADIPILKNAETQNGTVSSKETKPMASGDRMQLAIDHLIKQKAAKPRTEKTLKTSLHNLFKNELPDSEITKLFDGLKKSGVVKQEMTKVSYNLPDKV